jgi:hypothetical protein
MPHREYPKQLHHQFDLKMPSITVHSREEEEAAAPHFGEWPLGGLQNPLGGLPAAAPAPSAEPESPAIDWPLTTSETTPAPAAAPKPKRSRKS